MRTRLIIFITTVVMIVGCGQVEAMSGTPKSSQYKVKQSKNSANVEIIKDFTAPQLEIKKDIWVYLPPDYQQTDKKYPVLYMQEGEQLFDNQAEPASWRIDEVMNKLIKAGRTEGAIIIGIESSDPAREFVPWEYWNEGQHIGNVQGKKYAEFIALTLKPYIDEHYRTKSGRSYTGIAGGYLGGLISIYTGMRYQHLFSKIGAFSPAIWLYTYYKRNKRGNLQFKVGKSKAMQIYLDVGKKETNDADWNKVILFDLNNFYDELREVGFKQEELKLVIDETGVQSEKSWAERFPTAFLWLFEN